MSNTHSKTHSKTHRNTHSTTHSTKKRLIMHLKRYTNNSLVIRSVFDTLDNEEKWQRMVDYLEYAYRISEKLNLKRIMAKAVFFGLRRAPSVLHKVRREMKA